MVRSLAVLSFSLAGGTASGSAELAPTHWWGSKAAYFSRLGSQLFMNGTLVPLEGVSIELGSESVYLLPLGATCGPAK